MAFLVSFFTIFTSPFYFSAAFDLSNFESLFSAITSTIFLQDHQNSIINSIQLVKLMVPTNALGSSQYGSYLHVGTLISALQSHQPCISASSDLCQSPWTAPQAAGYTL